MTDQEERIAELKAKGWHEFDEKMPEIYYICSEIVNLRKVNIVRYYNGITILGVADISISYAGHDQNILIEISIYDTNEKSTEITLRNGIFGADFTTFCKNYLWKEIDY